MKAKINPRRLSDDFFTATGACSGYFREIAELLQLPDPAWRIALNGQRLIIYGRILIRDLTLQQHEDRFQDFMRNGDNGSLGSPTNDQALKFVLELTCGAYSGPCNLA